jgi:type I restriction enzyme, S subunit
VIPEGWSVLSLGEIVDASTPIVYGIVQAGPHIEDGVPYLKSSDVGEKIDVGSLKKTSEEIAQKYRRAEVRLGDIVISERKYRRDERGSR